MERKSLPEGPFAPRPPTSSAAAPRADEGEVAAAVRARDELLSNVAHQLRNPLNAIVSWVYLLRSGQLDAEETRQGLDALARSAAAQDRLLTRLLDFSRLLCNQLQLASQAVDLGLVVEAAVAACGPELAAAGVHVVPELATHCAVAGDPERLQQAVAALLSNAAKFAPGGRVQIRLTEERDDESAAGWAVLTIRDDGIGIDAARLPSLFTTFGQRPAEPPGRAQSGLADDLGIGLAVAHRLLALHGGSLEVASEGPGHGATFTVTLPIGPLATGPEEGTTLSRTFTALAEQRILLVATQAASRSLLRSVLTAHGAEVLTIEMGDEAAELLLPAPSVILVDLAGLTVDGAALVHRLHDAAAGARSTRIEAVALGPPSEVSRATQGVDPHAAPLAFDRILARPCRLDDLIATLAASTAFASLVTAGRVTTDTP